MSVTTIHAGGALEPVYSIDGDNLTWVLDSTNKALCSMKYVTDLYIDPGATAVARVKLSPNTTDGLCTLSINRVLEDFVSMDPFPGLAGFTGAPNSLAEYYFAFGEETDGTLGCTGASFQVVMQAPGTRQYAFNGTLQYGEAWSFTAYLYQDTAGTTARHFLTDSPLRQDIKDTEDSYLYYLSNTVSPTASYLHISVTSTTGAVTQYRIQNPLPNELVELIAVGVGPYNINAAAGASAVYPGASGGFPVAGPIIGCDTASYTVTLANSGVDRMEIRTFDVTCGCERYTPYRFVWLNRRGGFDAYTFRLKSTHRVDTKSAEYTRFLSRYSPGSTTFGYSVGDRGRTVFNNEVAEAYTVVSEWQDEATHAWLAELFTSTAVFISDGAHFYPIVVTKNSVEVRDKKGYGNRLLSHTIDFVRAYPTVIQRA